MPQIIRYTATDDEVIKILPLGDLLPRHTQAFLDRPFRIGRRYTTGEGKGGRICQGLLGKHRFGIAAASLEEIAFRLSF